LTDICSQPFALQEDDLDFATLKITVTRAFSIGNIENTKTGETREVNMADPLERRLRDHLRARREETLKRGWREQPELLFVSSSGTALDDANVPPAFRRCLRAAEITEKHSPYDLRQAFATNLLAQGVPITYVAAQPAPEEHRAEFVGSSPIASA
jgi:site-specific recombinase XerD